MRYECYLLGELRGRCWTTAEGKAHELSESGELAFARRIGSEL